VGIGWAHACWLFGGGKVGGCEMKKRNKKYQQKPVKNTLALFAGRDRVSSSDATRLLLIYRQIFERVRLGQADEGDWWAMAAMLEDIHIAVEYSDALDDKETTFSQLREAFNHIHSAIDLKRRALTGEGLAMIKSALEWHEGLIKNSSEYMIKQIVKVCEGRAKTGEFRVAQIIKQQEAA